MSRRSQKRKLRDKKHLRAYKIYSKAYCEWKRREPPVWRIFTWLRWKSERPYKPKDAVEYDELYDKYGRYWERITWRWY